MSDFFCSRAPSIIALTLVTVSPCAADSLAGYAAAHPLTSSTAPGESVVISNDTVAAQAERGWLTTASSGGADTTAQQDGPEASDPGRDEVDAKRASWRRLYRRQAAQVAAARDRVQTLDERIASLDRDRFAAGTAKQAVSLRRRVEELGRQRRQAAARLERERAELADIVRRARRDGAQPGWFR